MAKDAESALKAVTGGDFVLQDVLAAGELNTAKRADGAFIYDLVGPSCLAATLSTASDGRLFAFFVIAPAAEWEASKATFRAMRDSFQTYSVPG